MHLTINVMSKFNQQRRDFLSHTKNNSPSSNQRSLRFHEILSCLLQYLGHTWWQRLSAPPGRVPTPGSGPSSALLDSPPWCSDNAQNRPWIPPEASSLLHSFLDPLSEPHWDRKHPPGVCQDPTLYAEPIGRENSCSFLPRKKSTVAACSRGGTTVSQGDERETKREALS